MWNLYYNSLTSYTLAQVESAPVHGRLRQPNLPQRSPTRSVDGRAYLEKTLYAARRLRWTDRWWTGLRRFKSGWCNYETVFDFEDKKSQVAALQQQMSAPGFWNNQETAQQRVLQLKSLNAAVKPLEEALGAAEDLRTLVEMGEEDAELAAEVPAEIERLEQMVANLELQALLGGAHDQAGAIVSINARDGGTDAHDWAEMLLRMYTQWAQKNGYSVSLLDRSDNEEAGINSATVAVRGPSAYGYLRGETGVHRLVRISPFNAEGKRQTSFAAVDVSPEVSDSTEIEINEDDVREDTFRASGAGGQHVNKTSSAIRLTHMPSGIVVQCQNERSQHKNRAAAWKMLRSRLMRLEDEKREAEQAQKYRDQAKVGFGAQIRNYFQHPDQRIKDARTGHAATNFQNVMDGDIQDFLEAYLRWRVRYAEN